MKRRWSSRQTYEFFRGVVMVVVTVVPVSWPHHSHPNTRLNPKAIFLTYVLTHSKAIRGGGCLWSGDKFTSWHLVGLTYFLGVMGIMQSLYLGIVGKAVSRGLDPWRRPGTQKQQISDIVWYGIAFIFLLIVSRSIRSAIKSRHFYLSLRSYFCYSETFKVIVCFVLHAQTFYGDDTTLTNS